MSQQVILLGVFLIFLALIFIFKVKLTLAAMIIPILLEITGVLTGKEAWAGLTNSSVIMMFSMFIVAAGLNKTDIVSKLSRTFIKPGSSDRQILIGITIPAFLLGCVVNGATTMAIMLPIITGICAEQKRPLSKFMYPFMIMSMSFSGLLPLGGNAASYISNNTIINELGGVGEFNYFTNMIVKIPFTIAMVIVCMTIGLKLAPDKGNIPELLSNTPQPGEDEGKGRRRGPKPITEKQKKLAIIIFAATIVGVVVSALLKINTWYAACLGAFCMVVTGILDDREAIAAGATPIIFLFVGTLPLATAITKTGADQTLSNFFSVFTKNMSPFMVMLSMYLICMILTQFLQNSTVSNIFRMLAVVIAVQNGYSAMAMFLAATQGTGNCFLMPTANTNATMLYEAGGYTVKEWAKQGIVYSFVTIIVFCIYIPLLFPLVK